MAPGAREAVLTAPTAHLRQVRAMTRLPLITPGRSTSLDKPTSYTAAIPNQPSRFTSVAALVRSRLINVVVPTRSGCRGAPGSFGARSTAEDSKQKTTPKAFASRQRKQRLCPPPLRKPSFSSLPSVRNPNRIRQNIRCLCLLAKAFGVSFCVCRQT